MIFDSQYQLQFSSRTSKKCYRDVLALDLKYVRGIVNLAALVHPQDSRYEEAIALYRAALAAVNKITRRWTPGRAFQDIGATLVTASRAHCSDSITILWTKGHSERSKSPPSTWSRQQWGIYVEIAWARTTDKHRDPSPMLRQVTD